MIRNVKPLKTFKCNVNVFSAITFFFKISSKVVDDRTIISILFSINCFLLENIWEVTNAEGRFLLGISGQINIR